MAALIDGEGYIGATRRNPNKSNRMVSPRYSVRLNISMTDEEPIRVVADYAGLPDKVSVRKRPPHKTQFVFDIERESVVILLHRVMPFLIAKKKQAALAIELFSITSRSKQSITKPGRIFRFGGGRMAGKQYRVRTHSDEFVSQCDRLYLLMKRRGDGVPLLCA